MNASIKAITGKKRRLAGLAAAAVVSFLTGIAFFSFPSVNVLEWRLADHWARQSGNRTVSKSVAVVGVDEKFLADHDWPLEKDIYGDLIDFLSEMGARAIAFDINFADNLDACGKGDSIFRERTGYAENVVFSYGAIIDGSEGSAVPGKLKAVPSCFALGSAAGPFFQMKGAVLPYQALLEKIHFLGFNNRAKPFVDGIDRRMPLFIQQDSLVFPSLALVSSCLQSAHDKPWWDQRRSTVTLDNVTIRVDKEAYLYVNFTDSIPLFTVSQVYASHRAWLLGKTPKIGKPELDGRVVFIGNTAISLCDFGVTPLSSKSAMGLSPNVMMHARAAATIIGGNGINFYGRPSAVLFSALMLFLAGILFFFFPAQVSLPAVLLCLVASVFAGQRLYLANQFIPVLEGVGSGAVFCILGSLVVYFEKEFDRRYINNLFKCYLSPTVIEEMVRNREVPHLGGAEVYATAFFTDIEAFSKFSEDLAPAEVVGNLNEYFQEMTQILLKHNGTLDKFIGDAIVAFFGAPHASHRHGFDACTAAVHMQEALAKLRLKWQQTDGMHEGVKNLKMRIGINTGHFVTGNIGCDIRMNYTMIGDTVNLTSRLESAAKEYGVYTVVGEETFHAVKHDFHFRKLDRIQVKGRGKPLFIYQLMGMLRSEDAKFLSLIEAYEKGLETYLGGDFGAAEKLFSDALLLEKYPTLKNPSMVMRDRCSHLGRINPDQWDGIYRLKDK
jgi:class 3 adenylate cyclase/CHASE2 domain-containing sensor protein